MGEVQIKLKFVILRSPALSEVEVSVIGHRTIIFD